MSLFDIEQWIVQQEQNEAVAYAILLLDGYLRDLVLLLCDGLSKQAICDRMHITPGSFDTYRHLVRKRLRELLRQDAFDL